MKYFVLLSLFCCCMQLNAQSPTLRVLSFNIRYDSPRDTGNLWVDRKEKVAAVIRFHQADLIGIQEGLYHQLEQLDSLLPDHDYLGVGRDDGRQKGEFTAIFYRRKRLQPINTAHFWLSETPEVPGSMSWETACTRMVSHVHFRDLLTGQFFYHFNTHYDHISHEARYKGTLLLQEEMSTLPDSAFVLLTGDFNVTQEDSTYQLLSTFVKDTQRLSPNGGYGPDFSYKAFDQPGKPGHIIDYIFIRPHPGVQVLRHGLLSDNWDGKYPSDHLPVLLELRLTAGQ
ncbi:MAG: endonuclease/exonuclease/phosphatase family protein [Bacteroidota bacterium]